MINDFKCGVFTYEKEVTKLLFKVLKSVKLTSNTPETNVLFNKITKITLSNYDKEKTLTLVQKEGTRSATSSCTFDDVIGIHINVPIIDKEDQFYTSNMEFLKDFGYSGGLELELGSIIMSFLRILGELDVMSYMTKKQVKLIRMDTLENSSCRKALDMFNVSTYNNADEFYPVIERFGAVSASTTNYAYRKFASKKVQDVLNAI